MAPGGGETLSRSAMSKKSGIGMLVVAWLLLLGVVSLALNDWLEQRQNPNRQPRSSVSSEGTRSVVLRANPQHHYVTSARINGVAVTLLVDTGATDVVVSAALAHRLNLPRGVEGIATTANGRIRIVHTIIEEIAIGDIILRQVKASINPAMKSGDPALLGMSALKSIELRQRNGELLLIQT
jgi:aspartyl protease family protein